VHDRGRDPVGAHLGERRAAQRVVEDHRAARVAHRHRRAGEDREGAGAVAGVAAEAVLRGIGGAGPRRRAAAGEIERRLAQQPVGQRHVVVVVAGVEVDDPHARPARALVAAERRGDPPAGGAELRVVVAEMPERVRRRRPVPARLRADRRLAARGGRPAPLPVLSPALLGAHEVGIGARHVRLERHQAQAAGALGQDRERPAIGGGRSVADQPVRQLPGMGHALGGRRDAEGAGRTHGEPGPRAGGGIAGGGPGARAQGSERAARNLAHEERLDGEAGGFGGRADRAGSGRGRRAFDRDQKGAGRAPARRVDPGQRLVRLGAPTRRRREADRGRQGREPKRPAQ
jgi:hypothetical protein